MRDKVVLTDTAPRGLSEALFLRSAVNDGWAVSKRGRSYVFEKPKTYVRGFRNEGFLRDFINRHISAARLQGAEENG